MKPGQPFNTKLESCPSWAPYPGSMPKYYPFWASDTPPWHKIPLLLVIISHQQQSFLQGETNQTNQTNSRGISTEHFQMKNKRPLDNLQLYSQTPSNTRQSTRMKKSRDQCKQPNKISWTYAIIQIIVDEGSTTRYLSSTQTATQTRDLSLWSAEPLMGSEKQQLKPD